MKNYYIYIIASERNGTLYAGITSNLIKRIWQIDLIEEENPDWKGLYDEIIK
ncbi:GIY-YIG nuclease family protein [Wolbachia endosymbiont of Folsomia candida]|uniref:GIY-YIG nuclease family protein n=1 Tax=Wolbachia endosymbiont of Folsomia candida TaxID=169402 RepID=UPI000AB1B4DB|nr:GIY-YIG nuclease family protein [Wolbachia endosymbiont of Folsomia candida]AWW50826.1 hypothetical protein ASM33_08165 [Wolbachia endosymbiont of Folsomia candida]